MALVLQMLTYPLEALTNIKIPISLSNPLLTRVIETFYVVLTKYGSVKPLNAPPSYFSIIGLPVSSLPRQLDDVISRILLYTPRFLSVQRNN